MSANLASLLAFALLIVTLLPPSTARAAVQIPDVSARGVYAFDLATGIELFARDEHARMQIGSTVKVVTALVVMEYAELDQQVVILESDLVSDPVAFSNMALQAGDTLTVSQLLYGLLIPSGSDGAQALARHVGAIISGSDNGIAQLDAFVNEMNAYVARLGLENSRFTNPDGVDAPNAYSSAYDIAILGGLLMQDEFLASVVGEPGYSFVSVGPEQRPYTGQSTNQLQGEFGVSGIKTGSTGEAGGCVVLARQVNGGASTVITAVIGADLTYNGPLIDIDQRWDDARALLQFMDDTFIWTPIGEAAAFGDLATEMAVWDVELPGGGVAIPIPSGEIAARYQLSLNPDGGGQLDVYYDGELVGSLPLQSGSAARQAEKT